MGGFPNSEAVRETMRGLWARRMGAAALTLASVALGAGSASWSWWELNDAARTEQSLRAAGADSFAVRATSADPLLSTRCDQLRQVVGVDSAGAIITSDAVFPLNAPDLEVTAVVATPGFATLAFPGEPKPAADVVVGRALAETLGVSAGDMLALRIA